MFAPDDSEKRKEQLLALQKSKLERYEVELTSTRKVGHQLTDCILYYHSVVSHSLHAGVCSTAARGDCFEHLTQSQSEVLSHTHTRTHAHTHIDGKAKVMPFSYNIYFRKRLSSVNSGRSEHHHRTEFLYTS